ncbi:hypothetical protein SLEP1_g23588 [Rubroshorea leprosula]|uniref:Uncharacterized protein n=1 Tax=Rubroshorea leprosula TaxID=152421 RepID=A0AAV5JM21_9ROSI|nr:hypothetical protein SLEP1_g23588 [Rubroshorea leprosula]
MREEQAALAATGQGSRRRPSSNVGDQKHLSKFSTEIKKPQDSGEMWEGQEFGFKGACSENQMGKERRLRQWKQSLSVGVRQNPNVDFSQQPQRFQKSRAFPHNGDNVELGGTKVPNLAKGSRTSTNVVNSVFEL